MSDPQQPPYPQQPAPQDPHGSPYPPAAQHPQAPQYPQATPYPQAPQYPQAPAYPQATQYPQAPQYPQGSQYPQSTQYPNPQYPQYGAPAWGQPETKPSNVLSIISFPLAAIALLFVPLLFGGGAIALASVAKFRKHEPLGTVAFVVSICATVLGVVIGAIVGINMAMS